MGSDSGSSSLRPMAANPSSLIPITNREVADNVKNPMAKTLTDIDLQQEANTSGVESCNFAELVNARENVNNPNSNILADAMKIYSSSHQENWQTDEWFRNYDKTMEERDCWEVALFSNKGAQHSEWSNPEMYNAEKFEKKSHEWDDSGGFYAPPPTPLPAPSDDSHDDQEDWNTNLDFTINKSQSSDWTQSISTPATSFLARKRKSEGECSLTETSGRRKKQQSEWTHSTDTMDE